MGWVGIVVGLTVPALAEDPPTRVGSLNYISGEVAYALREEAGEPSGSDALSWTQADFNQPVCQDMSLRTGALARARVRIGPDAIQMSSDTWLNMLNLSNGLIEASVRYGRIHLQLNTLGAGESVELEMPRGSLWVLQAGAYDIDTGTGDQPTRIVVFEGKARFVGGQADVPIAAGEEVQVTGNYPAVATIQRQAAGMSSAAPPAAAPPAIVVPAPAKPNPPQIAAASQPAGHQEPPGPPAPASTALPTAEDQPAAAPAPTAMSATPGRPGSAAADARVGDAQVADAGQAPADDFLLWVQEADDQPQPQPKSAQYVSPQTTGYDALDRYGSWQTLPDAGPVWFPASVPDDWAPYRFGHWDSIAPWGWTWIDDQPWGFAPFHYGRWINVNGRWGWVPGAVVPHPVYAPALVAFVDAPDGSGGGPDLGPDGGPPVGWFPLGPGDAYAPWYAAGPAYVEQVNLVERGHFHEFAGRDHDGRAPAAWREHYFNRRFATVVPHEAFANGRRVDHEMMRLPAERLEHATVMRGAPRLVPAAMRVPAGPGGPHGEPFRAMPAAAGEGALRNRPSDGNPAARREFGGARENPGSTAGRGAPGAAGQPGRGGGRPSEQFGRGEAGHAPTEAYHGGAQQFGRGEAGHAPAEAYRGGAQQFGRAEPGRAPAEAYRGGAQQFGRAEPGRAPAEAYRGGAQQFGRPEAGRTPAEAYRGGAQQFGRPQAYQNPAQGYRGGAQQFGRPQAYQNPAQGYRGGAQQFGRPQAVQNPAPGYRGGAQQFGRPQAFQTPATSYRGGGMGGRATPQIAARPAAVRTGGGGAVRHK